MPAAWARIQGARAVLLALAALEALALAFPPGLRNLRFRRRRITLDDEAIRVRKSLLRYRNDEEIRDALARAAAAM